MNSVLSRVRTFWLPSATALPKSRCGGILHDVHESEKQDSTSLDPSTQEARKKFDFNVYGLTFEVGYTIALPLVLFALAGRYADKMFGTSPWLLLAGTVVSIFVSSFIVYRKVKDILT